MEPTAPSTPYGNIALAFGKALVAGNFEDAHALLTPDLRRRLTADDLRDKLYGMFAGYAEGEPESADLDEQLASEDWPGKLPGDLGWAYVSIIGDDFAEGVAVTVPDFEGRPLIRELDWGRP